MSVLDGINQGGAPAADPNQAAMMQQQMQQPQSDPNAGMQQMQNTAPAPQASAVTQPMSAEDILGIDVNDAGVYEGGVAWPKGVYNFEVVGVSAEKYTISKPEDHVFVGQEAQRFEIALKCIGINQMTYVDKDGKNVPSDAMQEYVGKDYKESVLFGNDGLVKENKTFRLPAPNETPEYPGAKGLNTRILKILGDEAHAALSAQTGGKLGPMIGALQGKRFACMVTHNINPNDPNARVQDQIALFEEFVQLA